MGKRGTTREEPNSPRDGHFFFVKTLAGQATPAKQKFSNVYLSIHIEYSSMCFSWVSNQQNWIGCQGEREKKNKDTRGRYISNN